MIGFIVLAVVMLAGAVGVVTLRQPVHAALSLVVTLLALAVTYVTLQAHFLAVIQVIVYAGAIMVLFLFVIMLLNVEGQAPPPHLRWLPPLAFATALLVAAGIAVTAFVDRAPLPAAARVWRCRAARPSRSAPCCSATTSSPSSSWGCCSSPASWGRSAWRSAAAAATPRGHARKAPPIRGSSVMARPAMAGGA